MAVNKLWKTPQDFINAILGKRIDTDGYPKSQPFQCWDVLNYFWKLVVGRVIRTKPGGNAGIKDCWLVSKDYNAGDEFELVTDPADLRVGDFLISNAGEWGHGGVVSAIVVPGKVVKLVGQNQPHPFVTEINYGLSGFLGAFRFKGWNEAAPAPKPTKSNEEIAEEVMAGKWGNDPERSEKLKAAGYDRDAVQAIVNVEWPKRNQKPAAAGEFHKGDVVVPTKLVDYNGTPLRQYHANYTVVEEPKGDRVVLGVGDDIWAAMNAANIRKA